MTQIRLKSSDIAGRTPTASQLALGELAANTSDGKLFMKLKGGLVACVGKPIVHPWSDPSPSDYLFNHFYGGGVHPFTDQGSGTGSSGQFLTSNSEGYWRLNGGTVAGTSRRALRSALSSLRLGQDQARVDLFRAGFYNSTNHTSADHSVIRLGFLNSDTAAPTLGCWLEANFAVSPNWRAIVLNPLSNGGNARIIDTGILINSSGNKDFQLAIAYDGLAWSANFLLSGASTIALPGVPVASGQELFFGASVLKTAGSTNNSISLDHMGGGIRQLL